MDTGRVVPAEGRERGRAIGDGRGQGARGTDRRAHTPRPERERDQDDADHPAADDAHRVDLFA